MARLRRRVAYLTGLAAGLSLSAQSAEGRVLAGIIEVLDAMAEEMERLDGRLGELAEYLGELDQDLFDLEEAVNGEDAEGDELWDEEDLDDPDDEAGDTADAGPADFEGAVVFDSGIPTRVDEDAGQTGARDAATDAADGRPAHQRDDELVDGLLLECPHCGTRYAVAMDELEFDREPEEDENEFEWVCPNCGEVVHDFLPDAEPDDAEDPLEAGSRGGTAAHRPAGDGAGTGAVGAGRDGAGRNRAPVAPVASGTAGGPVAGATAPVAPF